MQGAGLQGAGMTPAGYGDSSSSASTAPVILPSAQQQTSSEGSRRIDPVTRDYVMVNGSIQGMNNVQQLVLLAVANARPALLELDKLDKSFAKGVRAILSAALAPLAAQKLVELVDVTVRMNKEGNLAQGQAVTVLRWRDLTTNLERDETL